MSFSDDLSQVECPGCAEKGLFLTKVLAARPIGDFSLAGAQMKLSAHEVPALKCGFCDWTEIAKIVRSF